MIPLLFVFSLAAHAAPRLPDVCVKAIGASTSQFETKPLTTANTSSVTFVWKKTQATPSENENKKTFLHILETSDALIKKGACPKDDFDFVFVYPKISYAISSSQLAAIRPSKPGSRQWADQVIMRLSVVHL